MTAESPVEDLGLSVRTRNALRGIGCVTVADVLALDLSAAVRGLGRKTKDELLLALEARSQENELAPLLARVRRALRLLGVRRSAARGDAVAGLTARESEVLELAAEGLTNDAIARRLGIGHSTVKRLVASGARKLGADTRAQAVARYVRGISSR